LGGHNLCDNDRYSQLNGTEVACCGAGKAKLAPPPISRVESCCAAIAATDSARSPPHADAAFTFSLPIPAREGAGRERPAPSTFLFLVYSVWRRTLLRRLAAVDISLEADSGRRRGRRARGAASYIASKPRFIAQHARTIDGSAQNQR